MEIPRTIKEKSKGILLILHILYFVYITGALEIYCMNICEVIFLFIFQSTNLMRA